ncbi:MAG: hypothetical protein CSA74_11560 [Rhodobacterales bacterium]|nr:MAG: hypothetical protein CSA74_11560 [Rhodobacterales bacterium]
MRGTGPAPAPASGPLPGPASGLAYGFAFVAFLAHSLEEVFGGLPAWAEARGSGVTEAQFATAACGLACAAGALLLFGWIRPLLIPLQIAVAMLAGAFLANALSHLLGSLLARAVMPGLWTGLCLLGPGAGWLLTCLPLAARTKARAALAGAGLMPLLAAGALWLAA